MAWWNSNPVPAPAPIQPMDAKPPLTAANKTGLAAVVGSIAAGLLYLTIPADEGMVYVGYLDIANIPTKCAGDTYDVKVGKRYSKEECERSLDRQLIAHAKPVMKCVPQLAQDGRDYQRAASVSLAYNIGTRGFCNSTVAKRFRAGDWRGGCNAMLSWDKARVNGVLRPVRGLTLRRQRERALCMEGLS